MNLVSTKPLSQTLKVALSVLYLTSLPAVASPTENEFDSCKLLGVKSLEYCLKDRPHYKTEDCWKQSEEDYKKCVLKVKSQHERGSKKDIAERLQRERRL